MSGSDGRGDWRAFEGPWPGQAGRWLASRRSRPASASNPSPSRVLPPSRRISIAEIKAHPWYKRPLAAKHEAAEADVAARLAAVEAANRTKVLNPVRQR